MSHVYAVTVRFAFDREVQNPDEFEEKLGEALELCRQESQLDVEGQTAAWLDVGSLDFVEEL